MFRSGTNPPALRMRALMATLLAASSLTFIAPSIAGSLPSASAATACSTTNGSADLQLFAPTVSGLGVSINGVVIVTPGDTLTAINWYWGDGSSQTGCVYFPGSHTYTENGTYDVIVTATGTNGFVLETSEEVTVAGSSSTLPPLSAYIDQGVTIAQALEGLVSTSTYPAVSKLAGVLQGAEKELLMYAPKPGSMTITSSCSNDLNTLDSDLGSALQAFLSARNDQSIPNAIGTEVVAVLDAAVDLSGLFVVSIFPCSILIPTD